MGPGAGIGPVTYLFATTRAQRATPSDLRLGHTSREAHRACCVDRLRPPRVMAKSWNWTIYLASNPARLNAVRIISAAPTQQTPAATSGVRTASDTPNTTRKPAATTLARL